MSPEVTVSQRGLCGDQAERRGGRRPSGRRSAPQGIIRVMEPLRLSDRGHDASRQVSHDPAEHVASRKRTADDYSRHTSDWAYGSQPFDIGSDCADQAAEVIVWPQGRACLTLDPGSSTV